MNPLKLDHIAFWVAEREPIVERCERFFGMHVIERQQHFTLLGTSARHGKLTFFDAEGPRVAGVLLEVGLRVTNLAAARDRLPAGMPDQIELGEGIRIRLVAGPVEVEYDLDHVTLCASAPAATVDRYEELGFRRLGPTRAQVGGAVLDVVEGFPEPGERPLLNHFGLLVASAEAHRLEAEALGLEIESTVEAANTRATFVWGPDRVRVEYVEHKPTFGLT
jgi:catechol 2,3-dioxygenase-like lactoylglutathione lyase family enzyme